MYYEIYNDIPKIPEHLVTSDIEEIQRKYPDNWKVEHSDIKKYSLHPITDDLYDYLKEQFPQHKNFAYQIIKPGVPVYIDSGRVGAINYLIHLGGDSVNTAWYDDSDNLLESVIFPEMTWHYVKADIPHGIHNLTSLRVAITISVN